MKKTTIALTLALVMLFTCVPVTLAQEVSAESDSEFLEYHYQVNFDSVDVFIVNGTQLDAVVNDDSVSARTLAKVEENVNAFLTALSEYSSVQEEIFADLISGNLVAVSFTEAPLLFVDDHYERISVMAASANDSSPSKQGKFSLWTSVSIMEYPTGSHSYTSKTFGAWSENSANGKADYPDTGEDFVLQSTPNTWTRTSDLFAANYDSSPINGKEGEEFRCVNGAANYLEYAIQDDPFNLFQARQNTKFTLTVYSDGPRSTSARMINSYYIHTWKSMSLSVSISASSAKEVTLSVTPSLTSNQWKLYNYVTFNF